MTNLHKEAIQMISRFRVSVFCVFISLTSLVQNVALASCNCPQSSDCGPCKGGIVTLTLRYHASTSGQVTIKDNKATYFSGIVSPDQDIIITGTKSNGGFETNSLDVLIDGILNTNIDVNCGQSVFVNSVFGSFQVIAGESKQGGKLCCSSADTDNIAPTITNCPLDIEAIISSSCTQSANWTPPQATDDCHVNSFTSTHSPGEQFPIGITVVTYTATDDAGNSTKCSFNIVVKDLTAPEIKQCPSDIFTTSNDTTKVVVTWNEPNVADNCSATIVTSSYKPGALFSKGTTLVEYIAKDASGNSAVCKFNVIVISPDSVTVPLEINGFLTPDGDGINDEWKIGNINLYKNNKVIIVDRWGSLIFSAIGYNNNTVTWNGTNTDGKLVPAGTYFYRIDLGDSGSTTKKGFIELIK